MTDNETIADWMEHGEFQCNHCRTMNPPISIRENSSGIRRLCLCCVSDKGIYAVPEYEGLYAVGKAVKVEIPPYDSDWRLLMPVWYKFRELKFDMFSDIAATHIELCHDIGYVILYQGPTPSEACRLLAEGIRWYKSIKQ